MVNVSSHHRLFFVALFLLVLVGQLEAQQPTSTTGKHYCFATIIDGDTVPLIYLNEVHITSPRTLLSDRELRNNKKLIRNVKLMLPYAREGKRRLDILEKQIASLPKRERSAAIKKAEKELLNDYGKDLKRYTFSQGLVLIKLIDRETGRTTYHLVDELRGKLRATFYQLFARLFGYNLKSHFDPAHDRTDNLINRIVISVDRGWL